MALTMLLSLTTSRATPVSMVTIRVLDTSGLPINSAVVTLQPVNGSVKRPFSFPWRNAMAQYNEQFIPGTLIVPKGAHVSFPNLDRVRHSIYSFSKAAHFTIDLYGREQTRYQDFPVTGSVRLGCNIHDEMRGYIRVVDTPYAAQTKANGFLNIAGVSPGTFIATVWHPQIRLPDGEYQQEVILNRPSEILEFRVPVR